MLLQAIKVKVVDVTLCPRGLFYNSAMNLASSQLVTKNLIVMACKTIESEKMYLAKFFVDNNVQYGQLLLALKYVQ